jgi:hypothetical protein
MILPLCREQDGNRGRHRRPKANYFQRSIPGMAARVLWAPRSSLPTLAGRHRRTHAAGQVESTQDAKRPDLSCFLHLSTQMSGHDDARAWDTLVTEAFLKGLARSNIPRLFSAGAPRVRPRPPAAPCRVTRLAQPAGGNPGQLALTRTGNALNRKEAFAILLRLARQANAISRRGSTYMYPLACFGICSLAKSLTRKECTTRWRSPATTTTAISNARSLMSKAWWTPSRSLTKRHGNATEDLLFGADDARMNTPNEAVLAASLP